MVHLGKKELDAAVVGLINNPEGCIIPLDEFKARLPISYRNKNVVVDWLREKEFLDIKTVENCGTVKKAAVVAWTKKGVVLKKKHSLDIERILYNLNEGYPV